VMCTSTPPRVSSTVACDTAELLTGSWRISVPATVETGATIFSVNTDRPVFDSSRSLPPGPFSFGRAPYTDPPDGLKGVGRYIPPLGVLPYFFHN